MFKHRKYSQRKSGDFEKKENSSHIGVFYREDTSKWQAKRRSKHEKKTIYNGSYDNEETAAHASDTLARRLMSKGEHDHTLNFPLDDTEVQHEKVANAMRHDVLIV